jgi:hypothetical protein
VRASVPAVRRGVPRFVEGAGTETPSPLGKATSRTAPPAAGGARLPQGPAGLDAGGRPAAQAPALVDDTPGQLQAAAFGQGCVSVGHEDLRVECGDFQQLHTHRRSSTPVDLYGRVSVTNLCGWDT